jgi:branched-chain amino acid transport system substrate-binding protein
MKRLITSVLAVIVITGVAAFDGGCKKQGGAGGSGNANEIVIGEYASKTGDTSDFGISSSNGLNLAIDEANKAGGVLGKQIKLITADDESKADKVPTAVQRLINVDGAVAIIGEVASTRSLTGASICQPAKIPMLSPASTNPGVTKVGDYIFRICFTDDFQGPVLAQFAKEKGWKRVALLIDASADYSKGLSKAFREAYKGSGEIVVEESYTTKDKDFRTQLQKIKSAGVDAVCMPGYYNHVGLMLNQARELQLKVPFFGGDGWDSPETLKLGPVADGCYYTDHFHHEDPRPEAKAFLKAYEAKYGRTPDAMAALGYDSGKVMIDAIKRAGKAEPAAIRDALAQTKDLAGATGKITIDADRNARKPIVVLRLEGGKTHLEKSIMP